MKFIRLLIKLLSRFGVSRPSPFASFGGIKTCFGWMLVQEFMGTKWHEMEMKEMVFFETQFCILKGVSCGDQCIVNIGFLKSLFQLNLKPV